jgi:hypothetical protein
MGKTERLKFLIDTGAEISIVRSTRLRPETNYEPSKGMFEGNFLCTFED